MNINNLHIAMNSFRYGSRMLKETDSIARSGLVQHIYIAALHEKGLKEHEKIDDRRTVWRVRLNTRKWPRVFIVQFFKYLEFCIRIIQYACVRNIKIVNIHHLGLLPLGVFLKWLCRANLVYDAHELESEKNSLKGIQKKISQLVESRLIKFNDLVIVVSDGINAWYREKYRLSNIVTVLNCPKFQEPRRTRILHQELNISMNRKIILYLGGLLKGRGIEQLLKIFAEYDDYTHVLVLMGYGELEPLVKEYIKSNSNIYFHEAVAPSEVLKYAASADVGISFIENTSLSYHWCLPNKLFEYIMAGLPIIVSNLPEMRRIVKEHQIGVVLDELTTRSLSRALADLAHMDWSILLQNLRRTAEEFCWNNQAQTLLAGYKGYIFNKF